mmetsp:Transcript_6032/g.13623  ORF Transcript_6032/g.13623 Transcript_6032/m.13623 type:complete len:130 (+) Transcript_6032:1234-1623(+)
MESECTTNTVGDKEIAHKTKCLVKVNCETSTPPRIAERFNTIYIGRPRTSVDSIGRVSCRDVGCPTSQVVTPNRSSSSGKFYPQRTLRHQEVTDRVSIEDRMSIKESWSCVDQDSRSCVDRRETIVCQS